MDETKEKILLLLLGGLALGCSYTFSKQGMVLRFVSREWKRLDEKELKEGIRYLSRYEFISKNKGKNGLLNLSLTKKGRIRALNFQLENIKNKKEKWDGKWRIVAFDVPEKYKRERDALRNKLKNVGFKELQKSVFVTPVKCENEMNAFVKFFDLRKYVRFGVLEFIDNGNLLKKSFKLDR